MKHRSLLLFLLLILLLTGGMGFWLRSQQHQHALNRQLIAALLQNDSKQALVLVNRGADPNTRYNPPPVPDLKRLLNHLLDRSSAPADDSPTAFLIACGEEGDALTQPRIDSNSPEALLVVRAMLAHGVDMKARDRNNCTALHIAVSSYNPHLVQLLLEHDTNINVQDSSGLTPLMCAATNNDVWITRLLLHYGANVSLEEKEGNTALYFAVVECREEEIIRLLLAHGADPHHSNKKGVTPLYCGAAYSHPDMVALQRRER